MPPQRWPAPACRRRARFTPTRPRRPWWPRRCAATRAACPSTAPSWSKPASTPAARCRTSSWWMSPRSPTTSGGARSTSACRWTASTPQGPRPGLPAGPGAVHPGPLCRRRPGPSRAGPPGHHPGLERAVRPQHVHPPARRGPGGLRARLRHPARPAVPDRSGGRRRPLQHHHRAVVRAEDDRHRRHRICRRGQEIDLHRHELAAAGQGRDADALQRQHRQGRRRRAVLRPVRHRQDHPVLRPAPQADRRRRAWLGPDRHLQLRGRLLRQGDQPVAGSRTRDLGRLQPLRLGAGERHRRRARQPGPDRRLADREHPLLLPGRVHPQRRPVRPRRAAEERLHADLRRVRRAAADLPADPGAGDVPLPVRLHRAGRRHREGPGRASRRRRSAPASRTRSCRAGPKSTAGCSPT